VQIGQTPEVNITQVIQFLKWWLPFHPLSIMRSYQIREVFPTNCLVQEFLLILNAEQEGNIKLFIVRAMTPLHPTIIALPRRRYNNASSGQGEAGQAFGS
jgi:hypothetical protein